MRKILLATTAVAALAMAPAYAQEAPLTSPNQPAQDDATQTQKVAPEAAGSAGATTEDDEFGAAAGGVTGAIAGAVVGGPIGAVIGGFAGAVLGDATAVPEPAVQYVVANPVERVAVDADLAVGATLPETVTLTPIPDYPDYAYVYTDDRPVIVRMDTREVVYSPGLILPEQTVTYVESNPLDPVVIEGEIAVGATVPADVELVSIPDSPRYSYVYLDNGPAIVDTDSRTVVWVRG